MDNSGRSELDGNNLVSFDCVNVNTFENSVQSVGMENRDAPPRTPFHNQSLSLNLPNWNEGLKLLSPNLPRHKPARTSSKLGPPQRTPQARKPNFKAPGLASSAQRLSCGSTPANTPEPGANNTYAMQRPMARMSNYPNSADPKYWTDLAKDKEDKGDLLGAAAILESALSRLGPISPIIKATSALQAQMIRPKPGPAPSTSLKLYPSLRQDGANKEKKEKTLRFAGPHDEDSIPAHVQGIADRTAITPQHNAAGTEKKDRTPHVRFCTPAVEATKIPKTPVHSRSSNAGSTPFHSGGSRQCLLEHSDDSDDTDLIESGSPNTVTRRLLGPILMEKIEDMKNGTVEQGGNDEGAHMDGLPQDCGPAMSNMSDSDCMGGVHRYLLESEVSPTSGAVKVPFQGVPHSMCADGTTPHAASVSPLSESAHMEGGWTAGKDFNFGSPIPVPTPDMCLQATPALRTRVAPPLQGDATPSLCINPLYKSTPSTANSDAPNTAQYTPAVPADPMFYTTPANGVAPMTTPLMSALAAKTLFSAAPTIEEEPEAMDEDCEPAETASVEVQEQPHKEAAIQQEPEKAIVQGEGPVQPTVAEDQERSQEEGSTDEEANPQLPTALPSRSDDVTSMQSQTSEQQERACDVPDRDSSPPAPDAPTEQLTEASGNAAEELPTEPTAAPGTPVAQQPDQVQQEFSFAAARRVFPRTPASAVRRSRPEADDAPTPIRNPLRIATPARARPRVGHSEIRGLLQDPHAPSPGQAAALGSRNALSPMRARPSMRAGLGQAQLVTPKRRSARTSVAAVPHSTGKMLAAAGFAYTPNAALAGRLATEADGKPVLGDARDADLLASMDEVAESPVFLDASQLEDLASAMRSVSLTPSLEAACRSRSNTPERLTSRESAAITSAMPPVSDDQATNAAETTPEAPITARRMTRSAARKPQPQTPAGRAPPAAADPDTRGDSEEEGTPSFDRVAPRPPSARVTRSAAKALPKTPAQGMASSDKSDGASSNSSKGLSPTETKIRQELRRSTRRA
ncbi:g11392 [Coccomyxa elongata]